MPLCFIQQNLIKILLVYVGGLQSQEPPIMLPAGNKANAFLQLITLEKQSIIMDWGSSETGMLRNISLFQIQIAIFQYFGNTNCNQE